MFFLGRKNSSVELIELLFLGRTHSNCFFSIEILLGRKKSSVETLFLGRTWSKYSSSVEDSRNKDSLGQVGQKISSLGRDRRNIPFFGRVGRIIKPRPGIQSVKRQIQMKLRKGHRAHGSTFFDQRLCSGVSILDETKPNTVRPFWIF